MQRVLALGLAFLGFTTGIAANSEPIENEVASYLPDFRTLDEWALQPYFLVCTVDGVLQGRERNTGKVLWTLETPPLIKVEQISGTLDGVDAVWITEFCEDGKLLYFNTAGLESIPISIKELAERRPLALENVLYTGAQQSTFYAVNTTNGQLLSTFGRPSDTDNGILYLGRTDYSLKIHERTSGRIWRLNFARWSANLRDWDLEYQYSRPLDGLYITPGDKSTVYGVVDKPEGPSVLWQYTNMTSPVVQVFDIVQPRSGSSQPTELVALAQPPLKLSEVIDRKAIYVDNTSSGEFYALGSTEFPILVASQGSQRSAKWCTTSDRSFSSFTQLADLLRGVHPAECQKTSNYPLLAGPTPDPPQLTLPPPAKKAKWFRVLRWTLEQLLSAVIIAGFLYVAARQDWFPELFQTLGQAISGKASTFEEIKDPKPEPIVEDTKVTENVKKEKTVEIQEPVTQQDPPKPEQEKQEKPEGKRRRGKRGGRKIREAKKKAAQSIGPMENEASDDEGDQMGPLRVSSEILGYGSHGTTVFKGRFQHRDVAIKRMLLSFYESANREIRILQESDDHQNVVRYFCCHETDQFLYIALELCPGTLEDLLHPSPALPPDKREDLEKLKALIQPLSALEQVTHGLHHLHSLKIVHRDIKPQNILVANPKLIHTKTLDGKREYDWGPPRLLISDFGLCKKLETDQSSFQATTAAGAGTTGWSAPEISMGSRYVAKFGVTESSSDVIVDDPLLQGRRLTRAVDIFSLGCVFYYVLSMGCHPFGESYMRQPNIENENYSLEGLDHLPYAQEARHLISKMLSFDPHDRPDTSAILKHPLFWTDRDKLDLLVKVSDRLEHDTREEHSELLEELEKNAPAVVGEDWHERFPPVFIENLGKYRKYHGDRIIDLLRALRNKLHHYNDFSDELKQCVGQVPSGYLQFFTTRFPDLFMTVYLFAAKNFAQEDVFVHYFVD